MSKHPSYCLDISVGRNEKYREELIEFLKKTGEPFGVGKASRGMWHGVKILRVETPKAEELEQHIIEGLRTGDDNDYEVHYSDTDAQRSMTWLPDFDTEFGYDDFDLVPPEGIVAEVSDEAKQEPPADFPKFLMVINGVKKFVSMQEAGSIFSFMWTRVEVGGLALEADYSVRNITAAERNSMSVIAEQCESEK